MTKRLDPDPRVATASFDNWLWATYCAKAFKDTHCMCEGDEELMVKFMEASDYNPSQPVHQFLEDLWNKVREYREENDC